MSAHGRASGTKGRLWVRCACPLPLRNMRWLVLFLFALLLIGGGMKLIGMQLPVLDYPLGGPLTQPQVEIQQPDLNLP